MLLHVFCPLFCPRICRLLDEEKDSDGKPLQREGSLDDFDASRMLSRPPEPANSTGGQQGANDPHITLAAASAPGNESPDTGVRIGCPHPSLCIGRIEQN